MGNLCGNRDKIPIVFDDEDIDLIN